MRRDIEHAAPSLQGPGGAAACWPQQQLQLQQTSHRNCEGMMLIIHARVGQHGVRLVRTWRSVPCAAAASWPRQRHCPRPQSAAALRAQCSMPMPCGRRPARVPPAAVCRSRRAAGARWRLAGCAPPRHGWWQHVRRGAHWARRSMSNVFS